MLTGGDQHTFAHQAGGIADFRDVASGGGDFETIKICAAKDDAGAGRRGQNAQLDRRSAMQTHARALYCVSDCLFECQACLGCKSLF